MNRAPGNPTGAAGPSVHFVKGEKVEVLWEDGDYYPAQFVRTTGPNLHQIKWDDGGLYEVVPSASIRKIGAASAKGKGKGAGRSHPDAPF